MNLNEAIRHALAGNAMIFTGAGFSYKAKNLVNPVEPKDNDFPMGDELSYKLCDLISLKKSNNLKYVSNQFIKLDKTKELIKELKTLLTCKESRPYHDVITSLNWKRTYSTNYDDIFEVSGNKSLFSRTPVTLADNPRDYYNQKDIVIHLNGYINRLSPNTLNKEFKLTNSSYLTDDFIHNRWIEMFKQDLDSVKAVIFIGFATTSDLDLSRIIHQYDKSKMFFIISPTAPEEDIDTLSDFGQVFNIGIEKFSNLIVKEKETYMPIEGVNNQLYCFDYYYKDDYSTSEISDKDVTDLLIRGEVNLKHIYNKVLYFISRTQLKRVKEDIDNNQKKFFVVESSLGNGKTCFLKSLIVELSKEYHVFEIKKHNYQINDDIDNIINNYSGKKILIFDNYFLYYNAIKMFNYKNTDDLYFIFSARSFINDINLQRLCENDFIQSDNISMINLTTLNDKEIKEVDKLIMNYNLFPRLNHLSPEQRYHYIVKKHKRQFKNIILELFDNSTVKNEYLKIIQSFQDDRNKEKLLVLSIINKIIPLDLTTDDICFLVDYNPDLFIASPDIKEIVNAKNNFIIESSILSEKLLEEYSNKEALKLADFLIEFMKRADEYSGENKYSNLKRLLISASNIELIFDRDRDKDIIIKYYENIKNLKYCNKNYFFWLQYGITRLDLNEYDECEVCFENAREYIKHSKDYDKPFDTFQLDTHTARYLLQKSIYQKEFKGSLNAFKKAHKLIVNNRNKFERWHYPLKIASQYVDYYNTFKDEFSDEDLAIFIICCNQVIEKINLYLSEKQLLGDKGHHLVDKAKESITHTLKAINTAS